MKPQYIIGLMLAGGLMLSAAAQENNQPLWSTVIASEHPATGSVSSRVDQSAPASGSHEYEEDGDTGHTIAVEVWSSAVPNSSATPPSEPAKVSQNFATAGLHAAFRMELTQRKIENSLRRGFPLGEFWIKNDLDEIDDSVKMAALSVKNDSDREALQDLEKQSTQLRLWSEWLIQQNRNLALTEYYISSSTLDNDERFQSNVACTKSLVSMLSSRTLAQDSSCL